MVSRVCREKKAMWLGKQKLEWCMNVHMCAHAHRTHTKKLTWWKMEDGLTSTAGEESLEAQNPAAATLIGAQCWCSISVCRVVRMRDVYTNLMADCCRNHGEGNPKDLRDLTPNWPVTFHGALLSKPADRLSRGSSPETGDAKAGRCREISQCYKNSRAVWKWYPRSRKEFLLFLPPLFWRSHPGKFLVNFTDLFWGTQPERKKILPARWEMSYSMSIPWGLVQLKEWYN